MPMSINPKLRSRSRSNRPSRTRPTHPARPLSRQLDQPKANQPQALSPSPRRAGPQPTPPQTTQPPKGVRLHKALADAGVASRRRAEDMIRTGRVQVNGVVIREMGVSVRPEHDRILVDGQPVQRAHAHVYIMLHKPRNYLTTVSDPQGRRTVMDLLPHDGSLPRLYPVGRLDAQSEGL